MVLIYVIDKAERQMNARNDRELEVHCHDEHTLVITPTSTLPPTMAVSELPHTETAKRLGSSYTTPPPPDRLVVPMHSATDSVSPSNAVMQRLMTSIASRVARRESVTLINRGPHSEASFHTVVQQTLCTIKPLAESAMQIVADEIAKDKQMQRLLQLESADDYNTTDPVAPASPDTWRRSAEAHSDAADTTHNTRSVSGGSAARLALRTRLRQYANEMTETGAAYASSNPHRRCKRGRHGRGRPLQGRYAILSRLHPDEMEPPCAHGSRLVPANFAHARRRSPMSLDKSGDARNTPSPEEPMRRTSVLYAHMRRRSTHTLLRRLRSSAADASCAREWTSRADGRWEGNGWGCVCAAEGRIPHMFVFNGTSSVMALPAVPHLEEDIMHGGVDFWFRLHPDAAVRRRCVLLQMMDCSRENVGQLFQISLNWYADANTPRASVASEQPANTDGANVPVVADLKEEDTKKDTVTLENRDDNNNNNNNNNNDDKDVDNYEEEESIRVVIRDSANRVLEAMVPLTGTHSIRDRRFHHFQWMVHDLAQGAVMCRIDGEEVEVELLQQEQPASFNAWPHRLLVGCHVNDMNVPTLVFHGTILEVRFWSSSSSLSRRLGHDGRAEPAGERERARTTAGEVRAAAETKKPLQDNEKDKHNKDDEHGQSRDFRAVVRWPLIVNQPGDTLSEATHTIAADHHEKMEQLACQPLRVPRCCPLFDGRVVVNVGTLQNMGECMHHWQVEIRFRTIVTDTMMSLMGVTDAKLRMQSCGVVLNAEPAHGPARVRFHERHVTLYVVDAFGACCSALLRGTERQHLMDGHWHTLVWRCGGAEHEHDHGHAHAHATESGRRPFTVTVDRVPQDVLYVVRQSPRRFVSWSNWLCVGGHNVRNWKVEQCFRGEMSRCVLSLCEVPFVRLRMHEGPGCFVLQDDSGQGNHGLLIHGRRGAVSRNDTLWAPVRRGGAVHKTNTASKTRMNKVNSSNPTKNNPSDTDHEEDNDDGYEEEEDNDDDEEEDGQSVTSEVVMHKNNNVAVAALLFTGTWNASRGTLVESVVDLLSSGAADTSLSTTTTTRPVRVTSRMSHPSTAARWGDWIGLPDACFHAVTSTGDLEAGVTRAMQTERPAGHVWLVIRIGECFVTLLQLWERAWTAGSHYDAEALRWQRPYSMAGRRGRRERLLDQMMWGVERVLVMDGLAPFLTTRVGPRAGVSESMAPKKTLPTASPHLRDINESDTNHTNTSGNNNSNNEYINTTDMATTYNHIDTTTTTDHNNNNRDELIPLIAESNGEDDDSANNNNNNPLTHTSSSCSSSSLLHADQLARTLAQNGLPWFLPTILHTHLLNAETDSHVHLLQCIPTRLCRDEALAYTQVHKAMYHTACTRAAIMLQCRWRICLAKADAARRRARVRRRERQLATVRRCRREDGRVRARPVCRALLITLSFTHLTRRSMWAEAEHTKAEVQPIRAEAGDNNENEQNVCAHVQETETKHVNPAPASSLRTDGADAVRTAVPDADVDELERLLTLQGYAVTRLTNPSWACMRTAIQSVLRESANESQFIYLAGFGGISPSLTPPPPRALDAELLQQCEGAGRAAVRCEFAASLAQLQQRCAANEANVRERMNRQTKSNKSKGKGTAAAAPRRARPAVSSLPKPQKEAAPFTGNTQQRKNEQREPPVCAADAEEAAKERCVSEEAQGRHALAEQHEAEVSAMTAALSMAVWQTRMWERRWSAATEALSRAWVCPAVSHRWEPEAEDEVLWVEEWLRGVLQRGVTREECGSAHVLDGKKKEKKNSSSSSHLLLRREAATKRTGSDEDITQEDDEPGNDNHNSSINNITDTSGNSIHNLNSLRRHSIKDMDNHTRIRDIRMHNNDNNYNSNRNGNGASHVVDDVALHTSATWSRLWTHDEHDQLACTASPVGTQRVVAIDLRPLTTLARGFACLASSTGDTCCIPYQPQQSHLLTHTLIKAFGGHVPPTLSLPRYAELCGEIATAPHERDWKSFARYVVAKVATAAGCPATQRGTLHAELVRDHSFTAELIPIRATLMNREQRQMRRQDRESQKTVAQLTFAVGSVKVQSDMFALLRGVTGAVVVSELAFTNAICFQLRHSNHGIDDFPLPSLRAEMARCRPVGCAMSYTMQLSAQGIEVNFEVTSSADKTALGQWLLNITAQSIRWQFAPLSWRRCGVFEVEYVEYLYTMKTKCTLRQYRRLVRQMNEQPVPEPYIRFISCQTI